MTPKPHLSVVQDQGDVLVMSARERVIAHRAEAEAAMNEVLGTLFNAGADFLAQLDELAQLTKRDNAAVSDAAFKTTSELQMRLANLQDLAAKR